MTVKKAKLGPNGFRKASTVSSTLKKGPVFEANTRAI